MTTPEPSVPRHVGLILDGNRRWAKSQGLPAFEGHRAGYTNLREIFDVAIKRGVNYVSAYVFSTENWHRSKEEVAYLMKLLKWVVTHEVAELHQKNVRIVWLGSRQQMSSSLIKSIEKAEEMTSGNTGGTLALCMNHGGHREIAEAVRRMAANGVDMTSVTEAILGENIDHPELPPIDLIIRTSGEQRLSNFMLWRAAYSELIFYDKYWPAFHAADFDKCLLEYSKRQRRFGG